MERRRDLYTSLRRPMDIRQPRGITGLHESRNTTPLNFLASPITERKSFNFQNVGICRFPRTVFFSEITDAGSEEIDLYLVPITGRYAGVFQ